MDNIKIEIEFPKEIANYFDYKDNDNYLKVRELFLYQLIQDNKISFGKAAEMLGILKIQYITDLGKLGIPYFSGEIDDVLKDISTLEKYMEDKSCFR